jgi:hypothetical protein
MSNALAVNNPGGMRDGPAMRKQPGYVGATAIVGKGTGYAKFDTLTHGINAMKALLANDYLAKGFNTPRKVAGKWAPDGSDGNNSLAYAQRIAKAMHIGLDQHIAPVEAMSLVLAMAPIENPGFPACWTAECARTSKLARA